MSARLLRIMVDSLPSLVVVASAGTLTLLVWQLGEVVETAKRVHVLEEAVVAATAAEEVAFDAARQELEPGAVLEIQSSTGMPCRVSLSDAGGPRVEGAAEDGVPELLVEVLGHNQRRYSYRCEMLAGAAPTALGHALTMRKCVLEARPGLRDWIRQEDLVPVLMEDADLPLIVGAPRTASSRVSPYGVRSGALRRDDSLALLRIPSGTDLLDHVFVLDEDGICRPEVPRTGTIHLPGHLWLDRSRRPLIIELSRPLTVVARGNVYIGRSILVRGPGRLTLVARRGDSGLFVDRDADGRWSPGDTLLTGEDYRGPIEGTGAIYLGLPAQDEDPHHPEQPARLTVAASLLAQGEVYLVAGRTEILGALVMEQGLTRFAEPSLVLPGSRLPNTQRERVPGFHTEGQRRPGLLTFQR